MQSKNLELMPGDKLTSLLYDILYEGHNGSEHFFIVRNKLNNSEVPYNYPAQYAPCITFLQQVTGINFYGIKLYRGMKIIDLIDHNKFIQLERKQNAKKEQE